MGRTTDVLVIGGGPAGLAAAIAARRKGFDVAVADGNKPPIDKACGEGLLPGTLRALRELGIEMQSSEGQIFQRIRFVDQETSAEAYFSGEGGMGVRRTVLHQKMVERAQECGVTLLWNSPVSGISQTGATVRGEEIPAKWIIGADGIQSRVRHWSGLDSGSRRIVRFAQSRHYRMAPRTDCVEVHWGRRMQAYVTPLANEEACVALISRDPAMRFEEALGEFPALANALRKAELRGVQRGTITVMRKLDRVYRGNIALVGDASGSVDAITGEGLGLSFRQALALADALNAGDLQKYQAAQQRLARRPGIMASLLLVLDQCAPLRRRVIGGLAHDPELFSRMLAVHVDETSPAFLAGTSARLGWRLIAA